MKRGIALLVLPLLICAAPPLITGAVRDQHGDPIAGAMVVAGTARTQTDAAGLFTLDASAPSVRISCPYCVTADAPVGSDGTVAAIITRYDEVARDEPSANDVQTLPYASPEQTISLTPFVVLRDSRYAAIGPRLSQNGLSRNGGALRIDDSPTYDPVAGVRPSRGLPNYDSADISVAPLESAFRYGDGAGYGRFDVETPATGAVVLDGTQSALQAAGETPAAGTSGAYSSGNGATSRRFALWDAMGEAQHLRLSVFSNGQNSSGEYGALSSHQSGIHAGYTAGDLYLNADAWSEGSSAALGYTAPFESRAGTVALAGGITKPATITLFADASMEHTTGAAGGSYGFSADDTAVHADIGASTGGKRFDALAGIGLFDSVYASGADVRRAAEAAPLLELTWHPNAALRFDAEALRSVRLPSFAEVYGSAAPLLFDNAAITQISAEAGDLHRVRFELRAARADDSGLRTGRISAAGGFAAWEAAPYVTVRAWGMHVSDASSALGSSYYASVVNDAFTPSSLWLSYAPPSGVVLQLIERRDEIDRTMTSHLDAALTLPLRGALRVFAACEHRQGEQYCALGLRTMP